jgi:XTP/dITP diphosphohydrolase
MKLKFATSNPHKVEEARLVLEPYGFELDTFPHKGTEIQEEDVIKVVKYAADHLPAQEGIGLILEDSGLYINALDGFPASYSSYIFKTLGVEGILRLLEDSSDRSAHFDSAVALKFGNEVRVFTGRVYGHISKFPKGSSGFGFDPIFVPEGYSMTLGELSIEEKCRISHRGLALRRLAAWLRAAEDECPSNQ